MSKKGAKSGGSGDEGRERGGFKASRHGAGKQGAKSPAKQGAKSAAKKGAAKKGSGKKAGARAAATSGAVPPYGEAIRQATARGDEAEIRLREQVPDIVLLDWMVEGLSGIEVCRRLRRAAAAGSARMRVCA